ncbi:MAG: asparagine synthase (glutamine-hydrolyzing) [Bacteroidetes bacterium]|nr:asparagine synthase (glutamine-hydrolyzing) [Bacteroidota bacterium]
MCGITGIINFNLENSVSKSVLKKMTDRIHYRGPDDEGFCVDKNVGLGFRRLSIIDLNTGHQPLSNEDQSIWIVFNGEIYNYKELQRSLIDRGHIFKTQTDTETIVHLYEQYGTECLQYLRGMFAFAIWDSNKKELFCARDRFGIKPFYFYHDKDKFVFGSEIKSILQCDSIDKTLSPDAIDSFFAFGYITNDLSIYRNVKKLKPAHYLKLALSKTATIDIKHYWDIQFNPDFTKSEAEWEEEIRECLSESVRLHMVSDVPLGAFLSGGIDSGSVVSMMAKNSDRPIKAFTIGFKSEKVSEVEQASAIAKKYGCDHHIRIFESQSIDLLPELVSAYDEPFGDPSAIPTYYVSKLAREFVTVALSGDGGDELFAGYNSYLRYHQIERLPYNFRSLRLSKAVWGSLNSMIPGNMKGKGLTHSLSKGKGNAFAYLGIWPDYERQNLLNLNPGVENRAETYKTKILKSLDSDDYISRMQNLDMKTFMVDSVLTKVDRASMLNSLEVRVPILDHKFAELTFKIPSVFKLSGTTKKSIFKKAMASYLPESILTFPKKGFSVPLSDWFRGELKEYIRDTLLLNNSLLSSYVNIKLVRKVVLGDKNTKNGFSSKVWTLLVFSEWLRQNSGD